MSSNRKNRAKVRFDHHETSREVELHFSITRGIILTLSLIAQILVLPTLLSEERAGRQTSAAQVRVNGRLLGGSGWNEFPRTARKFHERISVSGRAINAMGEPVANAKIVMGEVFESEPSFLAETTTADDGTFLFDDVRLPIYDFLDDKGKKHSPCGEFQLFGKATGYGMTWQKPVRYYSVERSRLQQQDDFPNLLQFCSDERIEQVLQFSPEAKVSGTILNENGVPVSGISVIADLVPTHLFPYLKSKQGVEPYEPLHAAFLLGKKHFQSISDEQGKYHLEGIPDNSAIILWIEDPECKVADDPALWVQVGNPGFRIDDLARASVNSSGQKIKITRLPQDGSVDFTYRQPKKVRLSIVDEVTQNPLAGVSVEAIHVKSQTALARDRTDLYGRVDLVLPSGKYEILCIPPSESEYLLRTTTLSVAKKSEQAISESTIELSKGARVEFHVVNSESGEGIQGVRFNTYFPLKPGNIQRQVPAPWTRYFGSSMTDDRGNLRVTLPAETCLFRPVVSDGFDRNIRRDSDLEGWENITSLTWSPRQTENVVLKPGETTRLKFELQIGLKPGVSADDSMLEETLARLDQAQLRQKLMMRRFQARWRSGSIGYSDLSRDEICERINRMTTMKREECFRTVQELFPELKRFESYVMSVNGMQSRIDHYTPEYLAGGTGTEGQAVSRVCNGWEYAYQIEGHSEQIMIERAYSYNQTHPIWTPLNVRLPRSISLNGSSRDSREPVSIRQEAGFITLSAEVTDDTSEEMFNRRKRVSKTIDESNDLLTHSETTTESKETEDQNLLEFFFVKPKSFDFIRTTEIWRLLPKRHQNGVVLPELCIQVEFENDRLNNATLTYLDDILFPDSIPDNMFLMSASSETAINTEEPYSYDEMEISDIIFGSSGKLHQLKFAVEDVVEYANRRGWGVHWP